MRPICGACRFGALVAIPSLVLALAAGCGHQGPPAGGEAMARIAADPAPDSLGHWRAVLAAKEPVVVVALGDSVTELNWTTRGHLNWVGLMSASLFESGAAKPAIVVNAGVSGSTFTDGLARLDRDVLAYDPDLVIVGFGINDWLFAKIPRDQQRRDLEALIRRLQTQTHASILLRTPHAIVDKETFAWTRPEELDAAASMIREVAAEHGIALVDHYASWTTNPPEARAAMYDWIHPNEAGHQRLFEELAPTLGLKTRMRWMKE